MSEATRPGSDPAETVESSRPVPDTVEAFPSSPPPDATREVDRSTEVPVPSSRRAPTFGRYRIERQLGNGGMGEVYLAHDTQLDRPVALKMPLFDPAAPPSMLERFQREARAAANVNHPNICPVYDVGEHDGRRFISMAYVEGRPLSDYVAVGSRLSDRQIARTVRKIALGIAAAHDSGILHRDIKPDNVMVDGRNEPIVMDFGLARAVDSTAESRLTREGAVIGTPAYMAPEQLGGAGEIGPAVDVYALGVVLYELLTGRVPFDGDFHDIANGILRDAPPPIESFRPDVPPALASICMHAMAKRPDDRFDSMRAFARELGVYLKSEATTVEQPRNTPVTKRPAATREMTFDEVPYTELEEFRPDTQPLPAPRVLHGRKKKRKSRRHVPVAAIVGVIVAGIMIVIASYYVARMLRRPASADSPDSERPDVAAVDEAEVPTPKPAPPREVGSDPDEVEPVRPDDQQPPKPLDEAAPVVSVPRVEPQDAPANPPKPTPVDPPKPTPPPEESITIEPFFSQADRNGDGQLSGRELPRHIIDRADRNNDVRLSREEFRDGVKRLGRALLAPPGPGEFRPPGRRPPPRPRR